MIRALQILAVTVTAVLLVATGGLLIVERTWAGKEPATPEGYFLHGSTGTELMPLAVFQVLPDLFPENFQPAGKAAGDWIEQFGFVRGSADFNQGLPYGISISQYQPRSGAPSPVPFVGFNCSVCHVARIHRTDGDAGFLIYGSGNPAIDLVPFGDAIKTSVLDEKRLTVDTIDSAHQQRFHHPLSLSEKLVIGYWLPGVRKALRASLPLRGQPYGGMDLRNSQLFPAGPGRNEPMKETVRFLINETPLPNGGASKIPSLYRQSDRHWAQFDGSLHDPVTRNSLAALGVGASVYNLRTPGILHTLQQVATYVSTLDGPKYAAVFPDQTIDPQRVQRGRAVYMRFCGDCHGWPGAKPDEWVRGKRLGDVVSYTEVGSDPSRVTFRYYPDMAQLIYDFFPANHPLKPKRTDLRPNAGDVHGFINAPLQAVFSRAPYLHNGSVPALAELINLEPRPAVFFRGSNLYDPVKVGLVAPDRPDTKRYFRYDTSLYGNSNRGHDYPWAFHGPGWNEETLKDLLEYLKTL